MFLKIHGIEHTPLYQDAYAEGYREGKIEALRGTVLNFGTKRFGEPSPGVGEAVGACGLDRLERLEGRLFEASSWEDLLATP